ncbi:transglycosylase domain-containing protein [Bacillus pinisoli]|uniref:transglycosylase domain-containing protein n=1 Tax=Bacillus pinisoli TaxID=2901866 RepID=UPI001FF277A4|nr:PBP1A family penicillin-binding protein [Bacillus pinisoli]
MKRKLLIGAIALVSTIIVGVTGYFFILLAGNKVIDEQKLVMDSTTTLIDKNGSVISKLYIEDRDLVTIDEIPTHVQEAFISIEDARFYEHHGIDLKAIFRALYKDLIAGSKVEGGSTITQQLAKNVFLSNEKTWLRKTKEAIISINLERKYSKKKLLEMYLNQIYFGHGAYGIETAAKLYFNKSVSELTLEEGALLAGIPKSPTNYSPINNLENSTKRRNLVINMMDKKGYISAEEAVRAKGKVISLQVNEYAKNPAFSTYIDMVMDEAKVRFNLSNEELMTGGYTITVPINLQIQQVAYELFKKEEYFPGTDDTVEGSFILMDAKDGGVLAVIGGRNYVHKGINRAVVKRQPGSTLKPLAVYGPALEETDYHPYSMLVDQKLSYGDYSPENYSGVYKGKISMYEALTSSANAPAVWLLDNIGIEVGKKYVDKVGISLTDNGLAIALGGLEKGISPLEMTKAYRAFAKEGKVVDPFFIQKMVNQSGEVIVSTEIVEQEVFSPQTAWYVTRMLEAVVEEGTAQAGQYGGSLAGKTGTTSYTNVSGASRDAWFVGYTPDVVGALWMGYDTTNDEHYLTKGSSYPTKLFKKILASSELDQTASFIAPTGVSELEKPIVMPKETNLSAHLTFKAFGLFTVQLEWNHAEDQRVVYQIYEKKDEEWNKIGEVTGEGNFDVENVNIFNLPELFVVPYNPQTEETGTPSNVVTTRFGS